MLTDRIEINPRVMMGKPVIRGTRIPVELLLRKISERATETDLLDAYPRLEREDIRAAVAYAADTLAHEETIFLPRRTSAAGDDAALSPDSAEWFAAEVDGKFP